MRKLVSAIVGRQAAGMAITGGLLLTTAALGFIALGCLAVALYQYLLPQYGAVAAACLTAGAFALAALIVLLIVRRRLSAPVATTAAGEPASAGTDTAVLIGRLLQQELPKHAVSATVIALIGGVAAGLNPEATRNVARDILRALDSRNDSPE